VDLLYGGHTSIDASVAIDAPVAIDASVSPVIHVLTGLLFLWARDTGAADSSGARKDTCRSVGEPDAAKEAHAPPTRVAKLSSPVVKVELPLTQSPWSKTNGTSDPGNINQIHQIIDSS
jgi:hypothetical protein